MAKAKRLSAAIESKPRAVVFGVCVTADPRIDAPSRQRCVNIAAMTAEVIARNVTVPDGTPVEVVWSDVLVDGEKQADMVAGQFRDAGVDAIVVTAIQALQAAAPA